MQSHRDSPTFAGNPSNPRDCRSHECAMKVAGEDLLEILPTIYRISGQVITVLDHCECCDVDCAHVPLRPPPTPCEPDGVPQAQGVHSGSSAGYGMRLVLVKMWFQQWGAPSRYFVGWP
jgi:hypothetical protein